MERLEREYQVQIEWKAFELRPVGAPVPPRPKGYYERAWAGVRELCRQMGIPELQPNPHQPHSRLALEGQKFAAAHGAADAYTTAVFSAYFYAGRDIGDVAVLAEAAAGAGLDPDAFRGALADRRYSAAVDADEALAARWGITAVPCFVSGNRGAAGVQPYPALVRLVTGQDMLLDVDPDA